MRFRVWMEIIRSLLYFRARTVRSKADDGKTMNDISYLSLVVGE